MSLGTGWAGQYNPENQDVERVNRRTRRAPVDVSGPEGSNTFSSPVGTFNYGDHKPQARTTTAPDNPFLPPGASNPAVPPPKYEPFKLDRQEWANTDGVPQQILDLRQRALGGLSSGEQNAMRNSAVQNIDGTTRKLQNTLGRQQSQSGVRGGIAFAQGEAIRKQALDARANSERGILLRDADMRRQALNDLQGYVGKERYGAGAENLAEAQINMHGQAGFDQRQILNDILRQTELRNQEISSRSAPSIAKEKGGGWKDGLKKSWDPKGIRNFANNTLNPVKSIRDFARIAPQHTKDLIDPNISFGTKVRRPIDFILGKR